MRKRKYSILTKVGIFYLLFTLLSFLVTAIILHSEATKHMDNILEERLKQREHWVKILIERRPERVNKKDYATVKPVATIPKAFKPVYKDTVLLHHETGRKEVHRKRINYVTVKDQHYRIEVIKSATELYRFKDDVYEIILPVFIVLALVIILINYLLSGYLFAPFKYILRQMASFNLTRKQAFRQRTTSTTEFYHLQQLFEAMQKRIVNDYEQLKSYTENMSHELQTPLTIMQNKAEHLLSDETLSQQQAEKIKIIYDEVMQLSRLGSLLNLITKIGNEEFTDVKKVYTKPILEQHIQSISDFAANRYIEIKTTLSADHAFKIDTGLLDILIRNLLKNAVSYANSDSVIYIETTSSAFTISNEGPELEFDAATIFNRFTKGKNSKSLGLGLAIVKQICQISKLKISYQRTNGRHVFSIEEKTFD